MKEKKTKPEISCQPKEFQDRFQTSFSCKINIFKKCITYYQKKIIFCPINPVIKNVIVKNEL